ncbi:MAG TPA: hypothetical protein PLH07_08085 [Sulfurovum sp.]|nr:MAG: hypothetical protein B7Y63_07295 [Sulfurovum sp. 35-42-20]OYY55549.1 MAG: hypothetical protein B7Y52_05330 [Sulfurovum sp. 28-43-6]OYZ24447.1 MAG: hypothetical protein B7Y23_08850 [Sulfurovum sp. 16-42-52]OYZ48354.1 MAG: hypothetical protein B7Y13_07925 [Sulfurovum sp. 24-42-9]OZA44240.1 MAG: hypothetical protein B7X80_08090 [Sulfurovum sp. 17-42-90]OZA61191.1 MAG: hypothetical protein B7X69_01090 [Sulfurovum sp. 39-42-12]HQR73025.1 hypothetical protein [Sulfurovum sp.]
MNMFSLFLSIMLFFFFTACSSPDVLGKSVKKEYFTGGKIRSEFIMDDDTEQNGLLIQYGYTGSKTSEVTIRNGVKNGLETGYDEEGRVLWKQTYVNGNLEGVQKAFYPNGDLMVTYTYANGLKNGPAQTYNIDGTIHRRVMYRNGKLAN